MARSKTHRWLIRSTIAVAVLIILVVASTTGYSLYRLHQIRRVPSTTVVHATGPTENILLIGSTDRCSATEIKQFRVQCETGVNGINSDVVLVMHLDPNTGKASLLSIPRDTFVPDARSGGLYNKIDAALYDGPNQLAAAIEQDFGIPINHFGELNFETFEGVVNALGGLHLYFPDRLVDTSSGLDVHHTGCIYFNGSEALELVRSRHLYWFTRGERPNLPAIQAATDNGTYYTPNSGGHYDGSGDLGRITRVHLFLKALASAVKARGLGDLMTDNALIGAVAPNLTVDNTFSDSAILHLALDFRHIDIGSTPELTAPIVNDAATYAYKGYDYGLVVFPAEPQDQHAIDRFLGTTPIGVRLAPSSISVSVVDGTGSSSGTSSVSAALGALGYKMVATTASAYVGPVSETTVVYAPGHLQQAERVMSSLSGTVVLGEATPAGGADVSVVAGSDLEVERPSAKGSNETGATSPPTATRASVPAPAPTTTPYVVTVSVSVTAPSPGASSVAAPPPAPTNPNLGAPTSATPPVAPYDPRSCPAKS